MGRVRERGRVPFLTRPIPLPPPPPHPLTLPSLLSLLHSLHSVSSSSTHHINHFFSPATIIIPVSVNIYMLVVVMLLNGVATGALDSGKLEGIEASS